ncbi:MAG: hypothetical protein JWP31_1747 [Aeromicrobium sp.]|nr:hypothetical protein [Aeromicrobium sp.]
MLSWRATRRLSALTAATALGVGVLLPLPALADGTEVRGGAPGTVAAPPAATPAEVTQSKIPAKAPAERRPAPEAADGHAHGAGDQIVAELTDTDLAEFSMLGVTWSGGLDETDTHVEVRWRTAGSWSAWTVLHTDPAPEEGGRAGTEPHWVGSADGAQVRVISSGDASPQGLSLSTIDPEAGPSAESAGTEVSPTIDVTQAATVASPRIISRSAWGASNSGSCDSPLYGSTTRGAVIHHTAGNNSYDRSESAAIVKATQAFHMKARQWCDIGYNFLVDKYGQIFEGRAGGTTKPVRAAHSGNLAVNMETMGVSLMGTFDTIAPSDAMKTAVVDLVAWRFAQYGLKAKGTYSLGGKTLNRIAAHRNVVSTECPGASAYAWLSASGGLRDRVESKLSSGSSPEITGRVVSSVSSSAFTLGWRPATGAVTYEVHVSTSSGTPTSCGTGCRSQAATSSPSARITGLRGGTTYYAWVRALDASGRPRTSWQVDPKVVRTSGTAPAATPATVSGISVTAGTHSARLNWSAVGGATSYDVCVVADKAATSCARYSANVTSTTLLVRDLKPTSGTDYYVKVRADKGLVSGSWSAFRGFNLIAPSTSGNVATVPSTGRITIKGHGYGHGIGMSQHGAQGAAQRGVTFDKILARYYPGTALGSKSGAIRVLISGDTTDAVTVRPAAGLMFRNVATGKAIPLPATVSGRSVTDWRIVQVSANRTQSTLQYEADGTFRSYLGTRWTGDGQFEGPARISLVMPSGSVVRYRGAVRSAVPAKGSVARDTVNVLGIDLYVRGVLAAEMPSGWEPEALKAQAVAARTYGARSITASRYYDICDTTACQVYGGAVKETSATDAAVRATAGKIVTYQGAPALTQFSSSSGGYTAAGGAPYLKALSDPYDDFAGNPHHSWTTTVAATTIQRAYPSIGTLRRLEITKRTGYGDLGGRVSSIKLVGSSATVTITGTQARFAFGLKSHWFAF